jgi:predicted DsbA family dithiol-disulfide isomerase
MENQSKKERLLNKFGEEIFNSNAEILINLGKEIGINFDHDGVVAQTYDAHRLINYAKSQGKQEEMVEGLFHSYHEKGKSPADHDALSEAAASVGLDKEKVVKFLKSDEGMQQVKDEISQSLNKGITGVPHFTINNEYARRNFFFFKKNCALIYSFTDKTKIVLKFYNELGLKYLEVKNLKPGSKPLKKFPRNKLLFRS